jgi:mycothione reductase
VRKFDVIVIGAGSGLEISAMAVQRGLSVAVVESGPFGGTCLNRGCIPSKMLIHSADVMETIRRAHLFGIRARVEAIDWPAIVQRASTHVDGEASDIEEAYRQLANVAVYKQVARFVGEKTLDVGGEHISAPTIVIATGTRPGIPDVPGLADVPYVTSDDAMRLPSQPKRLLVVGGGFVAAELAHFFGALGTEITIIHRRPLLLRYEDEQVARRFTEVYQRRFRTLLDTQVMRASRRGDDIVLDVASDGQTHQVVGDALLLATGRVPNTDLLDARRAGVELDERGFVRTDGFLETNVPGIWALGDVVGRYLLKHSANLEAGYVAHNIFNPERKVEVDYAAMPHAVFSSPQVASVGLTESEIEEQGLPYAVSVYAYHDTAYGRAIEDRDGFVKVLAHAETRKILGCHIIGSEASILIQEAVNAMRSDLTTDAITESIYVHPAMPEVIQRAFSELRVRHREHDHHEPGHEHEHQ